MQGAHTQHFYLLRSSISAEPGIVDENPTSGSAFFGYVVDVILFLGIKKQLLKNIVLQTLEDFFYNRYI